ncbi:hypothetical protein J5Y03_08045 [Bacillus sp. RG28]|uniref:Uncharacterized protein n=1 Tax=Gottfriedia endophytica TaxID=2820819 RepID=A0A940NUL3_9BACI|nr:hypothetical protein [Gottfriedia endophytica]MBP0725143.1 hypothetical protein [Gottfriedia endophytica]
MAFNKSNKKIVTTALTAAMVASAVAPVAAAKITPAQDATNKVNAYLKVTLKTSADMKKADLLKKAALDAVKKLTSKADAKVKTSLTGKINAKSASLSKDLAKIVAAEKVAAAKVAADKAVKAYTASSVKVEADFAKTESLRTAAVKAIAVLSDKKLKDSYTAAVNSKYASLKKVYDKLVSDRKAAEAEQAAENARIEEATKALKTATDAFNNATTVITKEVVDAAYKTVSDKIAVIKTVSKKTELQGQADALKAAAYKKIDDAATEKALEEAATKSVTDYEAVVIKELTDKGQADTLKAAADAAVAKVGNADVKKALTDRIAAQDAKVADALKELQAQADATTAVKAYEDVKITALTDKDNADKLKADAQAAVDKVTNADVKKALTDRITAQDKVVADALQALAAPVVTGVSATNLKEVVVTFNKDIDSANAGTYTFPAASGLVVAVSKVDGNTVTLKVTAGTVTQQLSADLTIDAVKTADGASVAKTVKTVKFGDVTAPVVSSVTVTGPTKVTVKFSEPLATKPTFSFDNGQVAIVSDNFTAGAKSVELTLGTTPSEGSHTVTVSGGTDYAGFTVDKVDNTVAYAKDTTAPTFTVTSANDSQVVLSFDKAITNVGDANVEFYQTNVGTAAYKATQSLSADGKTLTLTFANPLAAGNVNLYLHYVSNTGAKLQDAWGNKLAETAFTANVVVDTTAPTITKVEPNSNTAIQVTYSKAVSASATNSANYTVKDADGNVVPFTNVTNVSGNTYSINFAPVLNGGNYTVSVKNVTDTTLKANKLADFTTTVAVADKVPPQVGTVQVLSDKKVKINFTEAMDAASITNKNNYLFGPSALDSNVTLTAVDNNKAVILDFTNVASGVQTNPKGQTINVGRVADAAGNLIAAFSTAAVVPGTISAPLFKKAEVTGAHTVKFYFDEVITSSQATDFLISTDNGVTYKPADAISVSVVDGKTVVTATTNVLTLPTSANNVVVATADTVLGGTVSGKNVYGAPIAIAAGTVTADKFAPVATSATASDLGGAANQVDTFTVQFSENLYVASVQDSDFTVDGYEVTGVSVNGSTVTLTVKEKTTNDLTATPKVTLVGTVEDNGRNVSITQDPLTAVAAQAGIDAANQAAANVVANKITALPAVTALAYTDKPAVDAARLAYNGLTATQKALVANYTTLTNAEAKITALGNVIVSATAPTVTNATGTYADEAAVQTALKNTIQVTLVNGNTVTASVVWTASTNYNAATANTVVTYTGAITPTAPVTQPGTPVTSSVTVTK